MYELYSLFGVPRSATDDEIKQAFRNLAKRFHPDTSEGASDKGKRFKDLSSAYEILGDPIKRRAYDRGEIDGYGNQRAGYSPRAERESERERSDCAALDQRVGGLRPADGGYDQPNAPEQQGAADPAQPAGNAIHRDIGHAVAPVGRTSGYDEY